MYKVATITATLLSIGSLAAPTAPSKTASSKYTVTTHPASYKNSTATRMAKRDWDTGITNSDVPSGSFGIMFSENLDTSAFHIDATLLGPEEDQYATAEIPCDGESWVTMTSWLPYTVDIHSSANACDGVVGNVDNLWVDYAATRANVPDDARCTYHDTLVSQYRYCIISEDS